MLYISALIRMFMFDVCRLTTLPHVALSLPSVSSMHARAASMAWTAQSSYLCIGCTYGTVSIYDMSACIPNQSRNTCFPIIHFGQSLL